MKEGDFLARHWKRITVAAVAAISAALLLIAWLFPESQLTLAVVSISTAAIGFLSWFAKSLMEHLLSKDIENHKLRLQAQNETELEKLRADLSRQALEHGVKFRRLDAKFDEHLVEVCKRLFKFYDRVSDYIGDFGTDDQQFSQEKLKAASAARDEFWDYFLDNRIYVPPSLHDKIRPLAIKLRKIAAAQSRNGKAERMEAERNETQLDEPSRMLRDEATPEFRAVEADVQKLLVVISREEEAGTC